MALSSLSASLQAAKGQLDALEQMRIPALEERLQEVSKTSAQVGMKARMVKTWRLNSNLQTVHLLSVIHT